MNFAKAVLSLAAIVIFATTGETAWARNNSSGHHHHHNRAPTYYPYTYTPAPAYSTRHKAACAKNPELEECVKERERMLLPSHAGNAAG